mmetsp:Transcript_28503/g.64655  ORF Transcript_28503/g.64655 Transcript_28503/m.64655 type:complete len:300 (-) Transcript_28503:255-1154(-)
MRGVGGVVEPPSGLGNFKGVMLCNRPADLVPAKGSEAAQPFRVGAVSEQVGLRDMKKQTAQPVKPTKEVLTRHAMWLQQLEAQVQVQKKEAGAEGELEQRKHDAIKDQCARQRRLVQECKEKYGGAPPRAALEKAVAAVKQKPLWAMSEAELARFEDEGEDLLDWVEGLDPEEYIKDLEFRQALEVCKDRCGRLQKEEDEFKKQLADKFNEDDDTVAGDDRSVSDGVSEAPSGGSRATGRPDKKDWDASTVVSDAPSAKSEAKSVASVLQSNSSMRSVHSQASVRKIMERVKEQSDVEG